MSRRGLLCGLALLGLFGCRGEEPDPVVVQPSAATEQRDRRVRHVPFRAESGFLYLPVRGKRERVPNKAFALYDLNVDMAWVEARGRGGIRRQVSRTGRIRAGSRAELAEQEAEEKQLALAAEGTTLAQRADEGTVAQTARRGAVKQGTEAGGVGQATESGSVAQRTETGGTEQVATGGAVEQQTERTLAGTASEERAQEQAARQAAARTEQVSRTQRARSERRINEAEARAFLRATSEQLARMVEQDHVLQHIFSDSKEEFRKRLYRDLDEREHVLVEKRALNGDGEPLGEIIPGVTFDYELTVTNHSHGPLMNVVLYDDFPRGLQFEAASERSFLVRGEEERALAEHPVLAFLTPNQWEEGKLAWIVEQPLSPGEGVRLRFRATYYEADGVPCVAAGAAPRVTTADGTEVEVTPGKDTVLVAEEDAGASEVQVSVRRADGTRVDGMLARANFEPRPDEDATDRERRFRSTVWAAWTPAKSGGARPR